MGEALERAGRMAQNLRVIEEAKEAAARGPAPDGEGYAFEDLAGAASCETPVTASDNADALALFGQLNAV